MDTAKKIEAFETKNGTKLELVQGGNSTGSPRRFRLKQTSNMQDLELIMVLSWVMGVLIGASSGIAAYSLWMGV